MTTLPPKVVRYLDLCVPSGLPAASHVCTQIEQVGDIRSSPRSSWMHFTAHQSSSSSDTQFTWTAKFQMASLVTGVATDSYESGTGRLDVKLWDLIPIVRVRGPEIDRGEAQRYLAELAWNPIAFQNNKHLRFCEKDDGRVRVNIEGDEETYVDLLFDNDTGFIVGAKALRSNGKCVLPWEGKFWEYTTFDGIRVPSGGEVSWETPEGKFVYWRGKVLTFRTNKGSSHTAK